MKIYLAASCIPRENSQVVEEFQRIASRDVIKKHTLIDSPEVADLILFVDNGRNQDWRFRKLTSHPLLERFPEKCLIYDESDRPWNAIPGIYVSMPRKYFDAGSQRAWAYREFYENTIPLDGNQKPDLLCSFLGRPCRWGTPGSRVRRTILALKDDRALIQDSSKQVSSGPDAGARGYARDRERFFAQTIARSKFILCPRGLGTSSYRLYETLRAGRVPVILADQWVPPAGPDWESLAIFIPENQARHIPKILRAAEPKWEVMATEARRAWETTFAPGANFHNMMEQCEELLTASPVVDTGKQRSRYRQLARFYWARAIYHKIRRPRP